MGERQPPKGGSSFCFFEFRPPTHFSHMSHPTFPRSHILFSQRWLVEHPNSFFSFRPPNPFLPYVAPHISHIPPFYSCGRWLVEHPNVLSLGLCALCALGSLLAKVAHPTPPPPRHPTPPPPPHPTSTPPPHPAPTPPNRTLRSSSPCAALCSALSSTLRSRRSSSCARHMGGPPPHSIDARTWPWQHMGSSALLRARGMLSGSGSFAELHLRQGAPPCYFEMVYILPLLLFPVYILPVFLFPALLSPGIECEPPPSPADLYSRHWTWTMIN